MFNVRLTTAFKAVAVVTAPLLCGAAYWRAAAPPSGPGLYVMGHGQHLYAVAEAADPPSDVPPPAVDSRLFPAINYPRIGDAPTAFYVYQPDRMSPAMDPSTLTAWYAVYDTRTDREFHADVQPMPITVAEVGDDLFRIDSSLLWHGWIPDEYARALARTTSDRQFVRPGIVIAGRVTGSQRWRRFFVPIETLWY